MARPRTANGYANPILPGGPPPDPALDQLMTTPGAFNTRPNPLLVRDAQRAEAKRQAKLAADRAAAARQTQMNADAIARAGQIVQGKGGFGLGLGMTPAQSAAARAALQAGDVNRAWDLMHWNRPNAATALTKGKGAKARILQAMFAPPKPPKGDPGSIA